MQEDKRRFLAWWKQLWPRTLWSIYVADDGRWFSIWRQWLWRVHDHRRFRLHD